MSRNRPGRTQSRPRALRPGHRFDGAAAARRLLPLLGLAFCLGLAGCAAPVGANKAVPSLTYRQTHDNAVSHAQPGRETKSVLHRFDQDQRFAQAPDAALQLVHQKAVESRERSLLFALSELNYLTGERLRRSVKPWETRDARDYYLAAAAYAWFYLFGDAAEAPPGAFDPRFRTACDLYNYSLGWALTGHRATNAVALLAPGSRRLPTGQVAIDFSPRNFPWPVAEFDRFVVADHFLVRGLSVRNRQPGLGTPLVGVTRPDPRTGFARSVPATVLLRFDGGWSDFGRGRDRGTLELYSTFDANTVTVGDRLVPLESDSTISVAYRLNQSLVWRLGMEQFLSFKEKIPTDVYPMQPYRAGRVPVVFVHGTFSSPVWWAEMVNTLAGDATLRQRYQFWNFLYNSGNPTTYSAVKLREALTAKLKELDPEAKDPALREMVVIGHSQGGLLAKLTATDTGDKLWQAVLRTNRLDGLGLTDSQQALIRRYTCYEALPFVKRTVFISTPHRGSYLANSLARRLARKFVSLPGKVVTASMEFAGMTEKLDLPKGFRAAGTSLDSMSPMNPLLLTLADMPLASGTKGHSIIAVKGDGELQQGKDGVVAYTSAHVNCVESEFVVRGPHSCQGLPPTIEEVRRILHQHLAELPAAVTNRFQTP